MSDFHSDDGDPIAAAEALIDKGRAHDAARDLRARLAAGRGGVLARVTLVKALLASNDVEGALAEAREAVSLNPGIAAALIALGRALLAAENLPAAIAELQRALRVDPESEEARALTGRAWLQAGEADKALEIFRQLSDTDAMTIDIARAEAILRAERSDAGYVRHLFDQFSADYDARMLGPLQYAAPQILAELADLVMPGRGGLRILDLGCGTGLAGVAFRARAAHLSGIDLSPAMIEKARMRGIYDALMVADLETALATDGPAFDLIVAADTLVYLGDLATVFAGAARHLARDGFFLFTAEAKGGADGVGAKGFELGSKRRWRHSEAYIRAQAQAAGLALAGFVAASPRTEANQPVPGLAVALIPAF